MATVHRWPLQWACTLLCIYLPLQVLPSGCRVNPTVQLQRTPVAVSLHVLSQPPLFTAQVSADDRTKAEKEKEMEGMLTHDPCYSDTMVMWGETKLHASEEYTNNSTVGCHVFLSFFHVALSMHRWTNCITTPQFSYVETFGYRDRYNVRTQGKWQSGCVSLRTVFIIIARQKHMKLCWQRRDEELFGPKVSPVSKSDKKSVNTNKR